MNKSSRGYKLLSLSECKDRGDQNMLKQDSAGSVKVTYGKEFWAQKITGRWFCNKPLSPVLNLDQPQINDVQNILINPDLSAQDDGNISSSADPFSDSSYRPSDVTESSSAPEGSVPDFDVYSPDDLVNDKNTEASSDMDQLPNPDKSLIYTSPVVDLPTVFNTSEISGNNDINVQCNSNISKDDLLATDKAVYMKSNSPTIHEEKKPYLDSLPNLQNSGRPKKLKNFCYFCETKVTNFARHITINHSTEIEVIKLSSLPLKSLERKRLLAMLRNKGNYLETATNNPRRVRRACIPNTSVLPCDNCLGFFSSKLLHRHRKKCGGKKSGRAQSQGQSTLVSNIRIDEKLRLEVFPRMRADKISLEAKSDHLICAFGARYLKTHREKQFATVTSRKMRELSKVLIEIKTIKPEVKSLFQALHPTNFDLFVQATQRVAKYDPLKETFEAPSFAMNIVNSFKQCCDIAINFVLRGGHQYGTIPAAESEAQFRTMKHLFTANWRFEVSSIANANINLNKWNKTTIVPLASDLKLLGSYLLENARSAIKNLYTTIKDVDSYNKLVETIYCRVILLNRRRPGELQRMFLETYLNSGNSKEQYEEFDNVITQSERILLKRLKRVVIRGKRGRGVPVLFANDVQEHIQIMMDNRSKYVPQDNLYLFAKASCANEISGYKILRKYAMRCGAKNPEALSSTRLRKHLATLTQVFNMSDNDIEQLASFMGHTIGVHKGSYRLPDDVYQTAKVSKLLLLMERGQAGNYQGKKLDEIDLDMENDLIEEAEKINQSDEEDEELTQAHMGELSQPESLCSTTELNDCNAIEMSSKTKAKKRRKLIPWLPEEKKLAKLFFKDHIKHGKPPKKHECQKLIDKYPDTFKNRDWLKIKVFIQNQYTKKSAFDYDD